MKILSIDTSTMISSCSVMEDGVVIGDYNVNQKLTHSETLVPMVKDLLEKLNIKLSEIDLYVVGKGPGSFTGLRIGMTVAKIFAQVNDKKVIGISTLKALASQLVTDKLIVPILDARGGRVYYGMYKKDGDKTITLAPDELIYFEDLLEELKAIEENIVFVGELTEEVVEAIEKNDEFSKAPASINSCIGRSLCVLGVEENLENIDENSYLNLKPEYIRKSQAQRDLEKRKGC